MDKSVDRNNKIQNYETNLLKLYKRLQKDMLSITREAQSKGLKVNYVTASLQKQVNEEIKAIKEELRAIVDNQGTDIYNNAMSLVDKDIKQLSIPIPKADIAFNTLNEKALVVLADNTYNKLENVAVLIGRRTQDELRTIGLNAIQAQMAGYKTYKQTADTIKSQLEEFVTYSNGRKVPSEVYARMVARTTAAEIHIAATQNRILGLFNSDVVELIGPNDEKNAEACKKYVNTLISLTGKVKELPTLDDYKNAGGFHPNCRHNIGVTEKVIQYYEDNNIDY